MGILGGREALVGLFGILTAIATAMQECTDGIGGIFTNGGRRRFLEKFLLFISEEGQRQCSCTCAFTVLKKILAQIVN